MGRYALENRVTHVSGSFVYLSSRFIPPNAKSHGLSTVAP